MAKKEHPMSEIRYCPSCGQSLADPRSMLNEYWMASDIAYSCWCRHCNWQGEIILVSRIVTYEPAS